MKFQFVLISLCVLTKTASATNSASDNDRDERSFFISSINRGGANSDDVINRNDDVIDSESGEDGGSLLDTFSLSFAGSFDFARTFDGVKQIFQGISSFIDLRVIRAGIDMMVATLFPSNTHLSQPNGDPLQRRSDSVHLDEELRRKVAEEQLKAERLKDGLTTVVGAVMQKQQCWEKTACTVGAYLHSATQAKEVVFILAEKVSPSSWAPTLDIIKRSAYSNHPSVGQCRQVFECDARKDGRSFPTAVTSQSSLEDFNQESGQQDENFRENRGFWWTN